MTKRPPIAVIGTGNMGSAIAERLLSQGYSVTVWNRTLAKTRSLEAAGAHVVPNVEDALEASTHVILVLFDAPAVRQVLRSARARKSLRDKIMMNVAHTAPAEIVELAEELSKAGARLSEVNVVSYPNNVRVGDAEFILAGAAEDRDGWVRIFGDLGAKVHHIGAVGRASKAEMGLWLPYAFQTLAIAYGVAAFQREELPQSVLESVLTANPILRIAGSEATIPVMAARSYGTEQWSIDNMIASVEMAADYAGKLGLPTEVFLSIRNAYAEARKKGLGRHDVAAVYEVVNSASKRGAT